MHVIQTKTMFQYVMILSFVLTLAARDTIAQMANSRVSHSLLENFDILTLDDVQVRWHHTRDSSFDNILRETTKTVNFKSSRLDREFSLLLRQSNGLLSPGFKVFSVDAEGQKHPYYHTDDNQMFEGKLADDHKSHVQLTYLESPRNGLSNSRLLTANIQTGEDLFVIEPSYLHRDNLKSSLSLKDTMIFYNLRDYNGSDTHGAIDLDQCQSINLNNIHDNETSNIYTNSSIKRSKRGTNAKYITAHNSNRTRCSLLVVVDTLFFKNIGRSNMVTTVNYVFALMDRVNAIFLNTTWSNDDETPAMTGFGFTIQEIVVHEKFQTVTDSQRHYNMETEDVWEARDFLENFSLNTDTKWFCLAHLLTHRRFNTSVLGLAFVASPRLGTIGGICSDRADSRGIDAHFNTGISTSKTSTGETLITRQADLLVAHELGHNFGAEHDPERCSPKASKGGKYLMHPYSVTGFEHNHRYFSPCSREAISHVLKRKASMCFSSPTEAVCGNGVVDKGEECDGGSLGLRNEDTCCDERCRLKAGVQCSDTHSLCCLDCMINSANVLCRQPEENNCKQASFCDGMKPDCPISPPIDDGTGCVAGGKCRSGECLPFCESIGLVSCQCDTKGDECRQCCHTPLNDTCTPYNRRDPYLADGTLCYRGVCDHGRCEPAVQDFVERFWDIVEDISVSSLTRFLMDNIVGVILFASIPIWLLSCYFIQRYDEKLKNELHKELKTRKNSVGPQLPPQGQGPNAFVPSTFGDESPPRLTPTPPPHVPIGFNFKGDDDFISANRSYSSAKDVIGQPVMSMTTINGPDSELNHPEDETQNNGTQEDDPMMGEPGRTNSSSSQHVMFDEVHQGPNGVVFYSTRV